MTVSYTHLDVYKRQEAFLSILVGIGWTMGSSMLSTLLVVGSLSIWETVFDVATPARLSELSNTDVYKRPGGQRYNRESTLKTGISHPHPP